jgi:predicted anti-sigma-YlaC factor YlaD
MEALSARSDGEDPGVDVRLLDAHLARCPDCRRFRDATAASRARFRMAEAPWMADLSGHVAKLNAVADRAGRWIVVRALLALMAILIIFRAAPALIWADPSSHGARHLGAFSTAYAVNLLVVVVRPARARTVLPVAQVLGAALLLSAVVDVVSSRTGAFSEFGHVPDLVSVVLVWLVARPIGPTRPARWAAPRLRVAGDDEQDRRHRAG